MTSTIFLVRHAAHDVLGRVLTGRMAGVSLGETGRGQAERVAQRLSREAISAVYTSPLERAVQTASPIAGRLGLQAKPVEELTDIDYGAWSGKSFAALDDDPQWAAWNTRRGTMRPPGGESMLDVQHRAVGALERLVKTHPDSAAILVSHADVIKVVVAYLLGLALDAVSRFEISPASVSTVALGDWGAKVHSINEVVAA